MLVDAQFARDAYHFLDFFEVQVFLHIVHQFLRAGFNPVFNGHQAGVFHGFQGFAVGGVSPGHGRPGQLETAALDLLAQGQNAPFADVEGVVVEIKRAEAVLLDHGFNLVDYILRIAHTVLVVAVHDLGPSAERAFEGASAAGPHLQAGFGYAAGKVPIVQHG